MKSTLSLHSNSRCFLTLKSEVGGSLTDTTPRVSTILRLMLAPVTADVRYTNHGRWHPLPTLFHCFLLRL